MALVECPECEKDVDETRYTCTNCDCILFVLPEEILAEEGREFQASLKSAWDEGQEVIREQALTKPKWSLVWHFPSSHLRFGCARYPSGL